MARVRLTLPSPKPKTQFVACVNCVNLTDGLDGLAGGTSMAYLFVFAVMLSLRSDGFLSPDFDIPATINF